jgi:hypothetical protein
MLEPDTRELLLDLLRPPDGWQVDLAVGTTFTLDLQALLVAPLSFAMFDWALDENGRIDPLAALEALRRYAGRTTVFCQAGMISLPHYQPLLVHLERCVVPVTPPAREAIFHPKVWLLRFTRDDHDPRYRLLTLTRNLTFDTSWDTVVALEGERRMRRRPSEPVAEFIRGLVQRGGELLFDPRREELLTLADEVAHIRFAPPDGFDQVRYHGLGLGSSSWPFGEDHDRALVVSPFVGAATVARLSSTSGDDVLVSRPESLDACDATHLRSWATKVLASDRLEEEALAASEAADDAQPKEPASIAATHGATERLRGLHAKLVVLDRGERAHVYTGSANVTAAAFGSNVEFLVELVGARSDVGTASMLETEGEVTSFGHLLRDYPLADTATTEDEAARSLAADLERARRLLGRLTYTADARGDCEPYTLSLRGAGDLVLPDAVTKVHCWRITAGQGHLITPTVTSSGLHADFGRVPEDGLTSFFAFEVAGRTAGHQDVVRFVVNARLRGGPEDRAERVLARLLRNRSDLMRYLQFLLADAGAGILELLEGIGEATPSAGSQPSLLEQPALMERLLSTLVHDPTRLVHVDRLLHDLDETGRIEELAPPGLRELWSAVDEVRRELLASEPS